MAPRNLTRFCERCQDIKFDETKFGAEPVRTLQGFRLDIPRTKKNKYIQEGFNTRINEHLSLHAIDLEDSFSDLPRLSINALTCDFCAFLKECLLSKEVTSAIADYGVDLFTETFRIGVRLSYSWEPKGSEAEKAVGLDALYVYILNIDSSFSKDKVWGPSLGRDVVCVGPFNYRLYNNVHLGGEAYPNLKSETSCVQWLRLRELSTTDSFNQLTLPWMIQVLKQCDNGQAKHNSCARLQAQWRSERPTRNSNPWMPTRLIDVSSGTLRLVATSSLSFANPREVPKYTALSYCWGLQPDAELQLRTTPSTKTAMKKELPFSELSPVQKDAVTITREMGIRYLWTDSLCIVQGDKEDWKKESERMGSIYSYAYFTIVSLMPSNQLSFLSPNNHEISIPFQSSFPAQSGIGTGSEGFYQLHFDSVETEASSIVRLGKWSPNMPSNRWVTRAWTFQEQTLSFRMFLFGSTGVRFVCQSSSETMSSQEGSPRSLLQTIQNVRTGNASPLEGYEKWRDFARDYSGRSSTKHTDRLPALQGLAKLFAKKMKIQGQYAAGLWRGDLLKELLWRHLSPRPRFDSLSALLRHLRDPSEYIAPSWSWVDRFSITFFCYDDAADNWSEWDQEFDLIGGNVGKETFGQEYGPLHGADSLPLMLRARVLGSPNLMSRAEIAPRGIREERPSNDLTIDIQGDRFHCMMDWSTVTRDDIQDVSRNDLDRIGFVLLASAGLNGRSSENRTAIGLVVHPRDSFVADAAPAFLRIGVFYCEPQVVWGIARLNWNDVIKETICLV